MTPPNWLPPSKELFFSRKDPHDLRWGDCVTEGNLHSTEGAYGLWGYADDEGIRINGGRPGARYAPNVIRRFLYRLTPPYLSPPPLLIDYGNWLKGPSPQTQIDFIGPLLADRLRHHPMITLGGGHDYGAVDGQGFLQWAKHSGSSHRPLIINIDAHLDVRPWSNGLHSGTPFSWLLDTYPNSFDLMEFGIQDHCASPQHAEWARQRNVQIISAHYIHHVGFSNALKQHLAGTPRSQPCYISLDIDAFSQSLAPGCSQSWNAGLQYKDVMDGLQWLLSHKKVRLFGVYEVSPPLDVDHRTSKLAAHLIYEVLNGYRTIG